MLQNRSRQQLVYRQLILPKRKALQKVLSPAAEKSIPSPTSIQLSMTPPSPRRILYEEQHGKTWPSHVTPLSFKPRHLASQAWILAGNRLGGSGFFPHQSDLTAALTFLFSKARPKFLLCNIMAGFETCSTSLGCFPHSWIWTLAWNFAVAFFGTATTYLLRELDEDFPLSEYDLTQHLFHSF